VTVSADLWAFSGVQGSTSSYVLAQARINTVARKSCYSASLGLARPFKAAGYKINEMNQLLLLHSCHELLSAGRCIVRTRMT